MSVTSCSAASHFNLDTTAYAFHAVARPRDALLLSRSNAHLTCLSDALYPLHLKSNALPPLPRRTLYNRTYQRRASEHGEPRQDHEWKPGSSSPHSLPAHAELTQRYVYFFITFKPTRRLYGRHVVFGQMSSPSRHSLPASAQSAHLSFSCRSSSARSSSQRSKSSTLRVSNLEPRSGLLSLLRL